ncbi:hypothetical protein GCM10009801_03470 [Streptomyces albiaxialis]|uniref:Uncharacterized protein n=1 Tax=Streptomyces albiaxialis TaxID=329523 RepID=A0ABP5H2N9_9ACTN
MKVLLPLPEFLTRTVALGRAVVTHSVTWPRPDALPEPLVLPLELLVLPLELEEPELELS